MLSGGDRRDTQHGGVWAYYNLYNSVFDEKRL